MSNDLRNVGIIRTTSLQSNGATGLIAEGEYVGNFMGTLDSREGSSFESPIIQIKDENGNVSKVQVNPILISRIEEKGIQEGNFVKLFYWGKKSSKNGRAYHNFAITKNEEVENAATA